MLGLLQRPTQGLRKAGQALINDSLFLAPIPVIGGAMALSGMNDPNSTDSDARDTAEAVGATLGVPVGMLAMAAPAEIYSRGLANQMGRPGGRLQNAMRLGLIAGGGALGYGAGQAIGSIPFSGAEHTDPIVRERQRLQNEALKAQIDYATQVQPLQEAAQRRAMDMQLEARTREMATQAIAGILMQQAQNSGMGNNILTQAILGA